MVDLIVGDKVKVLMSVRGKSGGTLIRLGDVGVVTSLPPPLNVTTMYTVTFESREGTTVVLWRDDLKFLGRG